MSRRSTPPGVEPSRLRFRDLCSEALAGVLQRPARSALTAVGTVLGVGTFVAVLGLTATAESQIDTRFDLLTATEVTVEDTGGTQPELTRLSFPADADERIQHLHGVQAAGVYWNVRLNDAGVRAAPVGRPRGDDQVAVVAASPGVLDAAEPHLVEGRLYDAWHDTTGQQVAVIGSTLAERLGLGALDTQPAVFIDDLPFLVVGVLDDVHRKPDLLMSVTVPRGTALRLWGEPTGERARMLISTKVGAARQIAAEAPLALDPAHPEAFDAVPPPDPRSLRTDVTSDLDQLFLLLSAICLVIGSIGIANTTLIAVLERTGEIGVRRALGARGRHVTAQFLAESASLGFLGGLVGTTLGVFTVLGVALARSWTPVVDPGTVAAAPAIGLVTGLAAGLYPAWRAARIQPAEALRR
ncbi:ABC transporter permease [Streptomyces sp. TLI_171]|uniref:ABC transporter permease n=1 Tax=Streptomyces sp. TLI_171 TaxID=1938859 RepID=UPI000C194937|nr:ABC transporter permease [Streptomyces sp. TLI_171]RKE20280.1 putative ABC transport system permease protein [Streptomyces sp. TLI_171]